MLKLFHSLIHIHPGYCREAGRRLTVGYICPDLFTHSVSYFAEAPLQHHSRDSVRLIVYSCVPKVAAMPSAQTLSIRP